MSLPQAIKTMLHGISNSVVPDARITYGTRNQDTALPAIVYHIEEHDTSTIGSTPIRYVKVMIQSIAETAEESQEVAETVELALGKGTYNSIVFHAVLNMNSILQPSDLGYGEETEPFITQTTADIYYKK